jgi:hypothetical protein
MGPERATLSFTSNRSGGTESVECITVRSWLGWPPSTQLAPAHAARIEYSPGHSGCSPRARVIFYRLHRGPDEEDRGGRPREPWG